MFFFIAGAGFVLLYFYSVRNGLRRFRNAVFVTTALVSVVLGIASVSLAGPPIAQVGANVVILATILSVAVLAFFLIGNGVTMIRKEGRRVANLLSLLLGALIIVIPTGIAVFYLFVVDMGTPYWLTNVGFALSVAVLLIAGYFGLALSAFVLYAVVHSRTSPPTSPRSIVILGSGLIRGEVPPLLRGRLDKALEVYRSTSARPLLVPSGGQGADEPRAEGTAMREYLLSQGVPEEDVVAETASTTTRENLSLSLELLVDRERQSDVVVVTSNYHALRAAMLAREVIVDARVIGAPTARYYVPSAFLREFAAVLSQHKRLNLGAIAFFLAIAVAALVESAST